MLHPAQARSFLATFVRVAFALAAFTIAAGVAFSHFVIPAHATTPQATTIQYTGPTAGDIGYDLPVSAKVTSGGVDVTAGLALTFQFTNGQTCTSSGPTCTISSIATGTGPQTLTISFAGTVGLLGSSTTASVTIGQLTALFAYTVTVGPQYVIANLTQVPQGTPIVGASVVFTFTGSALTCTAITDSSGNASCLPPLSPGSYTAIATYAGDGFYQAGSSDFATVLVKQATALTVTPPGGAIVDDPVVLSATVTDPSTKFPVSGMTVLFRLGLLSCSATSNASGNASCTVFPTAVGTGYTWSAEIADAPLVIGSSVSATGVSVGPEDAVIQYTGGTSVSAGGNLTVSASVLEDGTTAVTTGNSLTFSLGGQSCTTATGTCFIGSIASTAPGTLTVALTNAKLIASVLSVPITVIKHILTITPNDATRLYGAANPAFAVTIGGFVNGDTLATAGVTGSPACSTSATATSPVGTYGITCTLGTLASPTYSMQFVGGHLAVTPAPLTVVIANLTRPYHSSNLAFTAALTGLLNGDSVNVIYSTTVTFASPTGTYPINASIDPAGRGSNYLATVTPGTLTITRAPTTLVFISSPFAAYGSVPLSATLSETLNPGTAIGGETVSFNAGTATAAASTNTAGVVSVSLPMPVGQMTVSAVFGGDSNYLPSPAAMQIMTIYQPTHFVIWGGNQKGVYVGQQVTFRGPQWSRQVTGGNYTAGHSFKGWAANVKGSSWTTNPGEDSGDRDRDGTGGPPEDVPAFISVIVSTSITRTGHVINGNIAEIAVVQVDSSRPRDKRDREGDIHDSDTGVVVAIINSTTAV